MQLYRYTPYSNNGSQLRVEKGGLNIEKNMRHVEMLKKGILLNTMGVSCIWQPVQSQVTVSDN